MKHKTTLNDFAAFSIPRLERMAEALLIAIESPCSNKRFLEYCNRYDAIQGEIRRRI